MSGFSRSLVAAVMLLALLFLHGCQRDQQPFRGRVVAKVGENQLSLSTVRHSLEEMNLDPANKAYQAQMINRWVDRQLLLREAKKRGIHHDPEIARRVKSLEEELIIHFLYEELFGQERVDPEREVEYWREHTGEFTRINEEVRLLLVYTSSKSRAWSVRNGLDRSVSKDQMFEQFGATRMDTTGFLAVDRLPEPIARAIKPLRSSHASLPVELGDEWVIVKLLERAEEGQPRSPQEASDIVRSQLTSEERLRREYDFLANLRRKARREGMVQVFLNGAQLNQAATPDTSAVAAADSGAASSPKVDTTEVPTASWNEETQGR